MNLQTLLSGSAHAKTEAFNKSLFDTLTNKDGAQTQAARTAYIREDHEENDTQLWHDIAAGKHTLSFAEIQRILNGLQSSSYEVHPEHFKTEKNQNSPFAKKEFYDFLQNSSDIKNTLETQLETLRADVKKQKGYLSKAFGIFASEQPVAKVTQDVLNFEKHCHKHGISFDDVNNNLIGGDRENPAWKKVKDFRFLVAAVGGSMLGLAGNAAGVDILGTMPQIVNDIPGLFFKGLPYMALPFIALSIHRAFSEKSLLKEAPTLARFVGTMTVGIGVGIGVTAAMGGLLPSIDISSIQAAADTAGQAAASGEQPFSPSQYILHGIGASAIFASLYRLTKKKTGLENATKAQNDNTQPSGLSAIYNAAANGINKTGQLFDRAANGMDKLFHNYMNYVGVPAITLMMTGLMNKGGLSELANYGGYYSVMAGTVLACTAVLGGLAYAHGCRKEEMGEMLKTGTTAFSISSSAATMPVTKEGLKKMGVASHIRESVVPLGANFNMMGTAMFLGGTAVCAAKMLGLDPSLGDTLTAMGIAVATAFGAPGAPASMIIFLDPVLSKMGLTPEQAAEIYAMVIPGERPLDMSQTALNVTGDQIVALNTEAWENNTGLKKILPFHRKHPMRDGTAIDEGETLTPPDLPKLDI